MSTDTSTPLCVDLDGTLITNDVTWQGVKKYLHQGFFKKILRTFKLGWWLLKGGRSLLKHNIAKIIPLTRDDVFFNRAVVSYLIEQKKHGRLLYLATAADEVYAEMVMKWCPYFDGFFASNGVVNLRAEKKAQELCYYFGGKKTFSYAGNSHDDLTVWAVCEQKIAVNVTKKVRHKLSFIGIYIEL